MTGTAPLADLPIFRVPIEPVYTDEKQIHSDDGKESPLEKDIIVVEDFSDRESARLVDSEPIIRTGEDVSNFLFDVRDDGDPALTFRSFVIGTVVAALGAAMSQVLVDVQLQLRTRS